MSKKNKKDKAEKEPAKDMGFMGHMEEMRNRIIYALLGIIVGCIIAAVFIDELMLLVLLSPAKAADMELQNLQPFGQVWLFFKVIMAAGVIFSFPFSLYQLWKFIVPGLYITEKGWVRSITFFTSLCFLSGIAFAYFIMIPSMLGFSSDFGLEEIKNQIDVNNYFSFFSITLLASGMLFELPMISYILSKVGILTPEFLRKYRRHGILIMMILAAMLTPTTDPFSMMIFATPLFGLYEISIWISKFTVGKRKKAKVDAENEQEKEDKEQE